MRRPSFDIPGPQPSHYPPEKGKRKLALRRRCGISFLMTSRATVSAMAANAMKAVSFFMHLAVLTIELKLEYARSLKDRRQCVRSLKDSLRHGFNVSVAELDEVVVWQRATVGIASISHSRDYLRGQMQEIEDACIRIAENHGAQVSDSYVEFFPEE
ncbi:MAG TPA: DUF503 domain-containing protein [Acidobacteriaceae bacterium]|nr:DUF503 domain-containing protein [Acidobacteriaceae bacterium]